MNLDSVRRRLGPAPRDLTWDMGPKPDWIQGDDLGRIWDVAPQVQRHGRVALGFIFMANSVLFEDGEDDAPAGVCYSFDRTVEQYPAYLQALGARLYALHERPDDDESVRTPWHRFIADGLYTGMARPFHQKLPPEMSGGTVAFHSTLFIHRAHLQDRRLDSMLVPLLVHDVGDGLGAVALLVPPDLA